MGIDSGVVSQKGRQKGIEQPSFYNTSTVSRDLPEMPFLLFTSQILVEAVPNAYIKSRCVDE